MPVLVAFAVAVAVAGCGSGRRTGPPLYFSPTPGAPAASPDTQISVRGAGAPELRDMAVTGSRSGVHRGRLLDHPQSTGASFLPDRPFTAGETVHVTLREHSGEPIRFHFTVARPVPLGVQAGPPGKPTRPGQIQEFHSRPDLHPPTISVTTQSSGAASGDVFLSPNNKLGQSGPLILDGRGNTIWFHPLAGNTQAFDFREQRYQGKPVLTWWQGISARGYGNGEDVIYDSAYRQIATVKAANGYRADQHDFVITPQGTALIVAYSPVRADLSSVGGPREGTVLDGVVQELDIRTGLVLFEWHSLGNVSLAESYAQPATDGLFDYFHVNSVAVDSDGNLLVSARNTWTVYKINRATGKIMWRLGGKKSSFKMGRGTQFAYQHDARRQPDDTITLFDNGAEPQVHPQSRAIALRLDTKKMTATLVHEWTHPQRLLAGSQGNMQTLPNGDRFVGWGAQPNVTEFTPNGRVVFDAGLAAPSTSYRGYRFPWSATPPGRPAIATATGAGGKLSVYASWNGATDVARWRVLAGSRPSALRQVAEVTRTGFETAATVLSDAGYVAVEAQDPAGRVLGTSAAVKPGGRSA